MSVVTVKRVSGEVIGTGDSVRAVCEANTAYLRGAYLRGVYLEEAYLQGAHVLWSSHDMIAEILRRAAGDHEGRLMLAGYVLMRPDWCWEEWAAWQHPERDWAIAELRKWIREGDDAPAIIRGEEPSA